MITFIKWSLKNLKYRFGKKPEPKPEHYTIFPEVSVGAPECIMEIANIIYENGMKYINEQCKINKMLPQMVIPGSCMDIEIRDDSYGLRTWEVRVAITDESVEEVPGSLMLEGAKMGRAFTQAIDASGLSCLFDNAVVIDDLREADEAFTMADRVWVVGKRLPDKLRCAKETYIHVRDISYDNGSGVQYLFKPDDKVLIYDKDNYAFFTQQPMTVEVERDIPRGVWVLYFRKRFLTVVKDGTRGYVTRGGT